MIFFLCKISSIFVLTSNDCQGADSRSSTLLLWMFKTVLSSGTQPHLWPEPCLAQAESQSIFSKIHSCSIRVRFCLFLFHSFLSLKFCSFSCSLVAARITTALMYNDDKQARYTIFDNSIVAGDGTIALIMGTLNISR